ncbi:MAG: hypothetical protein ACI9O4_000509 [Chitinophagales bacterium]|jgi:uncharacterized protein (TIGR00369 family)
MEDFDYELFVSNYKQINTFMRENGIEHHILAEGETETTMTILDKHLSSPGVAHGGAMAGYMDSVLGFCSLSAAIAEGNLVSTVEFKLNYFKPIFKGDKLIGKGKVLRKGKSIVVSIAEIYRGDEMVAHGQGTFNVYPLAKRAGNLMPA